ncbi:uncharacterized protein G2W53_009102 [Senna tora]|uniref:Uncharacterized protein n=1 Tax=Senna tora TaxID=362788 RepID=A0A834WXT0_9FABA|nr:uncharacterized protein G2W53_009102 [Senna tora]
MAFQSGELGKISVSSTVVRMSDIAMLVAEEYERRIRKASRISNGIVPKDQKKSEVFSSGWVLGERLIMKEKKTEEELQISWAWKPKTQVAIAASTSFFSA